MFCNIFCELNKAPVVLPCWERWAGADGGPGSWFLLGDARRDRGVLCAAADLVRGSGRVTRRWMLHSLSAHGAGAAACGGVDPLSVASPVQTIVRELGLTSSCLVTRER